MAELSQSYHELEKCIEDILSVIKPTKDDRNKRMHAIQEIVNSTCLVSGLGDADVNPFGSFVSNLYAKSGDLDVSVELPNKFGSPTSKEKKNYVLRELMIALKIEGVARDVNFIPTARVPVLQYVSNHFGISCDISIDNYPGRIKSKVLYWISTIDERFGDMVLLVKEWAKAQNINDPKNGTLNSYSLCLLVLFHFQTCKPAILPPMKEIYDFNIAEGSGRFNETKLDRICVENIAKFRRQDIGQRNQSSLSKLLASFFVKICSIGTYSNDHLISTYTGELKQRNPYWMTKSDCFFVEDPFQRPENAARTVDIWLGTTSLRNSYPSLYAIAFNKHCSVADVLGVTPINLPFRRTLVGQRRTAWFDLIEKLMRVTLLETPDKFRWSLTNNGYSQGVLLDPFMVTPTPCGSAWPYGCRMFPAVDGHAGYLQQGWVASS